MLQLPDDVSSDLTNTEYGQVNVDGTYDVDDQVELSYVDTRGCHWVIESNWVGNDLPKNST